MNKKNICILFSIVFLQALVFYYPISTLYRTSHGLTLTDITIIESISFIITMVFELPWGILADRIGYKKVLILSNLLFFISKIIFYYAFDFNTFLLERIVLGITIAGLSGCDSSLLYESCGDNDSKHVFAIYSFLGTLGLMVASLSYSIFMKSNYQLCALCTVIVYGISFILTLFLDDYQADNNNTTPSLKGVWHIMKHHSPYLLIVVGSVLFSETIRECVVFFAQIKLTNIGLPTAYLGVISFMITLVGMISIVSGKLQQRLSYKQLITSTYFIAIPCLLCIWHSKSSILIVIMLIIVNALDALLAPALNNYEQEVIDDSHRASIISFYSIIGSSLSCVIDIMLGYAGDIAISNAYILGALFVVMALCLSLVYFKRQY
ncbi:MAG: MFS transporter [Erysipelotrichales bacterium]|nr:MFS transporter [Erysipelotrichales bacterium]